MPELAFSLAPVALQWLHDALVCLSKFNESVSIEAEYDQVSVLVKIAFYETLTEFDLATSEYFESCEDGVRLVCSGLPEILFQV